MATATPLLESKANPQQLEAILTTDGPVLIIAGPGSGKFATPPGQAITAAPSFQTKADTTMSAASLASVGSDIAHENRQPFLALRFCIACEGEFPAPA